MRALPGRESLRGAARRADRRAACSAHTQAPAAAARNLAGAAAPGRGAAGTQAQQRYLGRAVGLPRRTCEWIQDLLPEKVFSRNFHSAKDAVDRAWFYALQAGYPADPLHSAEEISGNRKKQGSVDRTRGCGGRC